MIIGKKLKRGKLNLTLASTSSMILINRTKGNNCKAFYLLYCQTFMENFQKYAIFTNLGKAIYVFLKSK